jgi:hypothetical protein
MKTLALLALCASLVLPLSVSPASALSTPEKLVYDVSWTGLKAATAVHEVTAKGDELRIVSTTRSAGWLNAFFSVDDQAESVMTRGSGDRLPSPKFYKEKINEGRFHALKEARFDTQSLKVETKDFLKKTEKTDPISSKTFDSLSCIYFVRSLDLVPGKSVFIDIYDCKRLWKTEVQVLRREEINTPLGRFKTVVVKPLLKAEGFFARSGDITVWLTDDTLRIPVKMTTKVKIGRITATLVGGSYWPKSGE